ncbi:DUF1501 domain-containing protein [Paracoccus sp. TK19116]|uniref:DUF1501 domain-containing protein n=1 Tax=Paracoccus albicereus TaxID=2922394 RepID=A0ABT1MUP1_9RHOB|nr:DUF1501 domain-containing protein [Paracoccus albicereus]MCQ0971181.1 DUF1501 domain-containing protein [Paracoccus albicereus]
MATRRFVLKSGLAAACSVAAHPLMSTVTFAAAPGDHRLVVIILRGAMDGLDVLQPYGDPALAALRPSLSPGPDGGALDLDGFFALHASLGDLMPLWAAGELAFVPAVSTPYRDKRSHFDGQDLLEAGTGEDVPLAMQRSGWLNRALQGMPGARAETAYAIGTGDMLLLSGPAPAMSWSPDARLRLSPQAERLLGDIYHDDPLFRNAAGSAIEIVSGGGSDARGPTAVADFAASRLNGEARIAAFSLTGWDTHARQAQVLRPALSRLSASILALRSGLGPNWSKTTVLAMTEFGRTARENGSGGTDHGTGGALLMAGGAIRGGRVIGNWPGLGEGQLYADRDLMPVRDVRAYAAWALAGLFGQDRGRLEAEVFPGLDMGADPGMLS